MNATSQHTSTSKTIKMGSTKLTYSKIYGKEQDGDNWMIEFLNTAATNQEARDAELLRIFLGLMKENAIH
jgi:hypothetical protein